MIIRFQYVPITVSIIITKLYLVIFCRRVRKIINLICKEGLKVFKALKLSTYINYYSPFFYDRITNNDYSVQNNHNNNLSQIRKEDEDHKCKRSDFILFDNEDIINLSM